MRTGWLSQSMAFTPRGGPQEWWTLKKALPSCPRWWWSSYRKDWTGQTTQMHRKKVKADSPCWGDLCLQQWSAGAAASWLLTGRVLTNWWRRPALSRDAIDSVEIVGERWSIAKLLSLMENSSHPMQETPRAPQSSFSDGLLHPQSVKERYRRFFLLLYNQRRSQ